MSQSMFQTPDATMSSSSYQSIFENALNEYKKKTKKDLRTHPLLAKLQTCDSPDTVLIVLREQIPKFDHSRIENDRLAKWLNPIVKVLSTFSEAIGSGVRLVYPPAGVVVTGIAILLSIMSTNQDAVVDVLERFESFFRRLEIYVEVPPTALAGMTDVIVKIVVEVLSVLAIVTKEIKQSKAKKYLKKLIGRTGIENALARLDRLMQDEGHMATAQLLKATCLVDNKVRTVNDEVQGVDDRVQMVDNRVKAAVNVVIDGGEKIREEIQQVAGNIDDEKQNRLRQDLRSWLSPPDPSVNYNTASNAHHEGTAAWFIESTDYMSWKSSGSLLWIYGKPGSGKSVLSSSIIRDIERISSAGAAHLAYFYFDFKHIEKQDARALLSSLIIQLSHQSHSFYDILIGYYLTHQSGSQQPSDRTLTQFLVDMLKVLGQVPIYLVIDALDECPNTTRMPSSRDKVLALVEELDKLNLPNLRLCVTSRPEIDIRTTLEPLTATRISLHDQDGQQEDIVDFVNSTVYSDKNMRRWRDEDKKMVIETISKRADGMFRWVFCQLESLRHCLPPGVRRVLNELPESLDETYERILREIPKSNQAHAHRLLQCLTVAVRPLRVEELAEVLAVEVDFATTGGIPKLNEDLRWEDQEQAVLSACSSLIAVVADGNFRVVQFSHFSVKEFLTSDRLATSKTDAFRCHSIHLEEAHTIMSQACLGVLLHLGPEIDRGAKIRKVPLTLYAAKYITDHAEFKDVLSHIRDGIGHLLDASKPQFAIWLWAHTGPSRHRSRQPEAVPLYCVSQLGFRGLADYLISKCPGDLTSMGEYGTPLHVALYRGHANVAQMLVGHYVDVDIRNLEGQTPLHMAIDKTFLETVRILIKRNADINARDNNSRTPLHRVAATGDRGFEVARLLVEHGADAHAKDSDDSTPLHGASGSGSVTAVQLLLDHGSNPNAMDSNDSTPLHSASGSGNVMAVQLLLDHGSNPNARDKDGRTPLYRACRPYSSGFPDVARLLLEHGADIGLRDNDHSSPLHVISHSGNDESARVLLEHGANVHLRDKNGQTPLHRTSDAIISDNVPLHLKTISLLLEYGADVNTLDNDHSAPLDLALDYSGAKVHLALLLIDHGANIHVRDEAGQTVLHRVMSQTWCPLETGRALLKHGADIDALDNNGSTPLHLASRSGNDEGTQLLLEHGANVHLRDNDGRTPLHQTLRDSTTHSLRHYHKAVRVIRLLLGHDADVNALDNCHSTPLDLAFNNHGREVVLLLLEHGANIHARDEQGRTALHRAWHLEERYFSDHSYLDVIRFLLEHGADVGALDDQLSTPLHVASNFGDVEGAKLLLEYGANIHLRDEYGQTPLHLATTTNITASRAADVIRLLLEHDADVDAMDNDHLTPLHIASFRGNFKATRLLLDHEANILYTE